VNLLGKKIAPIAGAIEKTKMSLKVFSVIYKVFKGYLVCREEKSNTTGL